MAYLRGGLTEQYLSQAKGIEQRFMISGPLALGGADLVVAGAVRCAGELETMLEGWLWCTPKGVVSLGDVRAYDAQGRELPVAMMEVTAGGTRIVVEGVALACAAYPVIINPEWGPTTSTSATWGRTGTRTTTPGTQRWPTTAPTTSTWCGRATTPTLWRRRG